MDLQDFKTDSLYFDEAVDPTVQTLLQMAAEHYGSDAEPLLRKAQQLAPENLSVLVGLYRFFYYQHRYLDAIDIAYKVMAVVGKRVEFPDRWQDVDMVAISNGVMESFTLVRFYLFALKAAGYLHLRIGKFAEGKAMITKVVSLDSADRLGARLLLEVLGAHNAEVVTFPVTKKAEACS